MLRRHFNTAGPMQMDIHYAVPPLERLNLPHVLALIDERKYFVLHAPRQTGKTSTIMALAAELESSGRYRGLYINIEGAQSARNDVGRAMQAILSVLAREAKALLGDPFPDEIRTAALAVAGPDDALGEVLSKWAEHTPLPICLFIDEIDALVGDSLISVLRQLRAGYTRRPERFPHSLILCGVRDVRDYRIHGANEVITGGSAFNIKAESLRLGDFSIEDIRRLYAQHTGDTGQPFEDAIYPLVWDLTRGQPWLVNALAYQACFRIQKDRSQTLTCEHILQAKEKLIVDRVTHLDQLTDKLKEPRVRRVIGPIVANSEEVDAELADSDDAQYLIDLGLIRRGRNGFEIANSIYREVIPRELSFQMQDNFMHREDTAWYVRKDGTLDMRKMLLAFQQFFRENSEIWLERYEYKEAGPQLIMQAFLQRIVNGGGRIDREYGLGRRRTDLFIQWGAGQRVVIELKILRGTLDKTIDLGLSQIAEYMDRTGTSEAHLIIFDRRPEVPWDDKVFVRDSCATPDGLPVTVWGM